ncbi:MAG: cobalamin-dependent protein [Planctomycetota bacterium]
MAARKAVRKSIQGGSGRWSRAAIDVHEARIIMSYEALVEEFFEALIEGDRALSRGIVERELANGFGPERMHEELFWPVYELVDRLFRNDQLSQLSYNTATRLLRMLVDQASPRLGLDGTGVGEGKSIAAFCGPNEAEELGAQIAIDLLESHGFSVTFAGGGIASDEIQAHVQNARPDVLLMFCSAAADLPGIRGLIDTLRDVNACPETQIVVGGGVFNRAEGLAEEIGADLWASTPLDLVESIVHDPDQRATPEQRTVGRIRRKAA